MERWEGERDIILTVSCADGPPLHSTFTLFLGIFLLVIVLNHECYIFSNHLHASSTIFRSLRIKFGSFEAFQGTEEFALYFLMGKYIS